MAVGYAMRTMPSRWPLVGRREEMDAVADALADRRCHGVLICGPAGVGKTRLAEDCLDAARRRGRAGGRATATATAATVPLGALAPLLPASGTAGEADPVARFNRAAASFRERAGAAPYVLLVDDVHLLDVTSAVLLGQLLDAAVVVLLGTLRTGEPVPDAIVGWQRSDRVARIDLADLSLEGVDSLLHLALGGPVTAATAAQVWAASRGNPLFVRELVLGSRTAGDLVAESGVWRLTGPLRGTTRLTELIGSRLGAAGASAEPLLGLLALAEPVGLAEAEDLAGAGTVEALERAALIQVRLERRRHLVSLAHPLYGEVLRARMPVTTRRRLLLDQAARVELRYGARRREDPLRIATWRLDATGTAEPGLLLRAARLARYNFDLAQAARLARAALADLPAGSARVEAQLLLGEALDELGDFTAAEAELAGADAAATDEHLLMLVVAARANVLLWGLRRPDVALDVIRDARARVTGAEARRELVADEATVLVYSGRPVQALQALDGFEPGGERRSRAIRAIAEAPALVSVGRCADALAVARQGYTDHVELGDQLAISHVGTHLLTQSYALQDAGRIVEAVELCTAGYQVASEDRAPNGRIWFAIHLGRAAIFRGRPATARRWLAEARALCREYGSLGPHRLAVRGLAMACAWLGDVAAARAAIGELDTLAGFGFQDTEMALGRAWVAAADGDLPAARDLLRGAAARAARIGHVSSEAWLLHDLARLGDPATASDRLAEIAASSQGELYPAYAAHATAAAGDDPDGLAAAADRFEQLAARLLAAEAATEAGHAYRRRGNPRRAAALHARAAALAEQCEGARTPGLVTADTVVPLTRREREVAVLASGGQSSRQIAERLHLSVRTIDNHLQNAYGKLGIGGRDELAAALAPGSTDVAPPVSPLVTPRQIERAAPPPPPQRRRPSSPPR